MTSAFTIQVDSQLKPDSGDETTALLRVLIYEINNTAFGDKVPTLPQWTGPPLTMVHVQAILFASLAISLLSAFLAMLGKQWLNRYVSTDMRGSAVERSHNRQRKLDGIVTWYFDHVMESLPLMLQAALLLLGCALSRYLWDISIAVASVVIGVTSLGLVFYLSIIVAGAVSESCPYQTPGSHILRHLGPKIWRTIWRTIRSARPAVTSAIRNALKQSRVIESVAEIIATFNPRRSRSNIIPFLKYLLLEIPPGFAIDVYQLGRATTRGLSALPVRAYRLVLSAKNRLQQKLAQQTTPSHLRCISWTLQTSLDKPIHLTTLKYLLTVTDLTGLDPTLVTDCFNIFVGCVNLRDHKLVVMQGLEQLATVSAGCLFRTLCHLSATDPTSSILVDLRRRYIRIFPFGIDFNGLPFDQTAMMTHSFAHERWDGRHLKGDGSSSQEYTSFARHMAKAAQVGYRQARRREVPEWILYFVLDSLSLDPLPPVSVVADCLTIAAMDLDCDASNIMPLEHRCVQALQIPTLLTEH